MTLCSGITLGNTWQIIWGYRYWTWVDCVSDESLSHILFLWPHAFFRLGPIIDSAQCFILDLCSGVTPSRYWRMLCDARFELGSSLYNARVLSCIVSSESQSQFFLMPTDLFQFNLFVRLLFSLYCTHRSMYSICLSTDLLYIPQCYLISYYF